MLLFWRYLASLPVCYLWGIFDSMLRELLNVFILDRIIVVFMSVLIQQGKKAPNMNQLIHPLFPTTLTSTTSWPGGGGITRSIVLQRRSRFMVAKHFRARLHRINSGLFKTINVGLLSSIFLLYFFFNLILLVYMFFITVIKELTPPYLWPHCHLAAWHCHYNRLSHRQ